MSSRARFCAFLLSLAATTGPLLAADGDADATFSADGQTTYTISPPAASAEEATAVVSLPDGSLLVGGLSVGAGATSDFAVVKYGAAGGPDIDFGTLGSRTVDFGAADSLFGIVAQPDGRIVLVGWSYVSDDPLLHLYPALARLTPDGDLDPTFGTGGRLLLDSPPWPGAEIQTGESVEVTTTGKLVLHGRCRLCPSNDDWRVFVLRLLPGGAPDTAFDGDGWFVLPVDLENLSHRGLALDAANRPVIGAILPDPDFTISFWRLTTEGTLDPTFGGGDGRVDTALEFGNRFQLLVSPTDGRIYLWTGGGVYRFLVDAAPDIAYGDGGLVYLGNLGEGSGLLDATLQSDGKLVGVGVIDPDGSDTGDVLILRLLDDGTLDSNFGVNGIRTVPFDLIANGRDRANALTLSGGKLVAAGHAVEGLGGASRWSILRAQSELVFTDGFERGSIADWAGN